MSMHVMCVQNDIKGGRVCSGVCPTTRSSHLWLMSDSEFVMPSSPSIRSELMLSDPLGGPEQEPKVVTLEREPNLNAHERYHIQDKNVVFVVGILVSFHPSAALS
jgi:hypothetical protein